LLSGLFSIPAPLSTLLAGLNSMGPSALVTGLAGQVYARFQVKPVGVDRCGW